MVLNQAKGNFATKEADQEFRENFLKRMRKRRLEELEERSRKQREGRAKMFLRRALPKPKIIIRKQMELWIKNLVDDAPSILVLNLLRSKSMTELISLIRSNGFITAKTQKIYEYTYFRKIISWLIKSGWVQSNSKRPRKYFLTKEATEAIKWLKNDQKELEEIYKYGVDETRHIGAVI